MTAESILLVDDNQANLQMLFQLLEKSVGGKLLVAKNGETALNIARKIKPDLVLLDIMMPGIDGFEVCRRLRADPALKHIPVIILTAMADPKLNAQAFKAGANLALRKPAEAATILRTLQAAVALSATKTV